MFIRMNLAEFLARSDRSDEELRRILSHVQPSDGAWIAGGSIRRLISGKPLTSDFDFFFRDATHLDQWCSRLIARGFTLQRESEHHKQFKGTVPGSDLPIEVQAIRFAFYGSAEEVIDSFDYTICQFALDGEELVTSPHALWDLGCKRLAIHKITYPVSTMRRMLKYSRQGFTACAGSMAEILRQTAGNPALLDHLNIEYVD